jgi:hypothetical protein
MIKVGGEVDAICTRCELTLAHTVHAVVDGRPIKVECNTCHTVHRYRGSIGAKPARGPAGATSKRAPREKPTIVAFDDLLSARTGTPVPYSPKRAFTVDDVVDHPTFGRGFVTAVRDGGKIEVTFRSDVKLLVHGRA